MSDYDKAFEDATKGAYDDAFNAAMPKQAAQPQAPLPQLKPHVEGMGAFDKFAAGYGSAIPYLWRGIKQAVETNPVEMKRLKDEEAEARRLDEGLGGWGSFGRGVGTAAPAGVSMMLPGGNTVAGAAIMGGLQGAVEPLVGGESRAARAVTGAGLGGFAQWAMPKAAMALADRVFKGGQQQAANASKDAVQSAGRDLGLVVAPSEAGGGKINTLIESVAGKAALKQEAQRRNAEVIKSQIVPDALGLPRNQPVTGDALQTLRQQAGQAGYAPIDQMGQVNWTPQYVDALTAINRKFGRPTALTSGERVPAVAQMVEELNVPGMTGKKLNDTIKNLREMGNKNAYAAYGQNPQAQQFGKAQVAASGALEDLASENLRLQGKQDLIPALLESRKTIAQAHDVERMLNQVTGDVSPALFIKKAKTGLPQSGPLQTLGEFGASFPNALAADAARIPTPGVSALGPVASAGLAMGGAAATGNPMGAIMGGLPLLRGPARSLLLSKPYQAMVAQPSYPGHSLLGITPGMADSEIARLLARSVAPQMGLGLLNMETQ
jgi:hypothetical protein